jgi:hypothetical protein
LFLFPSSTYCRREAFHLCTIQKKFISCWVREDETLLVVYEFFCHKPISRDSHLRSNELCFLEYNDANTNMDRWSVKPMVFFLLLLLPHLNSLLRIPLQKKMWRDTRHNTMPTAKLIFFTASLFNKKKKDNYIFTLSLPYLFKFHKKKNILFPIS